MMVVKVVFIENVLLLIRNSNYKIYIDKFEMIKKISNY